MSQEPERRSDISCRSCRRRKVKCDRRYPQCLVCEQTAQACSYPPGPLKPGPKIGSLRPRKRQRLDTHEVEPLVIPDIGSFDGQNAPLSSPLSQNCSSLEGGNRVLLSTTEDIVVAAGTRVPDLSFILHPAHETAGSQKELDSPCASTDTSHPEDAMRQACTALRMSRSDVKELISIYFDNMMAISLFHQPTFPDELARITSGTQMTALLAAMFAFAVRFLPSADGKNQSHTHRRAADLLNLAVRSVDAALDECGDLTPPLCLLQAAILAAHIQLTRGVLGRAWRLLGTCVRLAYEMNLHLVDMRHGAAEAAPNPAHWCKAEEKRRAWWAVWEMDVFATTIRRTPTAVDWSQLETLLPARDEDWFAGRPRPSCFLELDPIRRWKALQACGTQAPQAWFLVVNSLMKEAQRISSPRGVPIASRSGADSVDGGGTGTGTEARQQLELIGNALRCFRMTLPGHLQHHAGQYLGFEARGPGEVTALPPRKAHCAIYNVHMMIQLARLMIYRYEVFKGRLRVAVGSVDIDSGTTGATTAASRDRLAGQEYFDAASEMLALVRCCSDDHVRYINPFLSNTIWLASAVHVMHAQLCRPGMTRSVLTSRYEVLHLTYRKCVRFWDMHPAVQRSLETLEQQLEAWQARVQAVKDPPGLAQTEMDESGLDLASLSQTQANQVFPTPSPTQTFYNGDWPTEALDTMAGQLIDPMFFLATAPQELLQGRELSDLGDWRDLQLPDMQDIFGQ